MSYLGDKDMDGAVAGVVVGVSVGVVGRLEYQGVALGGAVGDLEGPTLGQDGAYDGLKELLEGIAVDGVYDGFD